MATFSGVSGGFHSDALNSSARHALSFSFGLDIPPTLFPSSARTRSEPVITSTSYPSHTWDIPMDQPGTSDLHQPPTSDNRRSVSPAATEIIEPDQDQVTEGLDSLGIKIRDFAYDPSPGIDPIPEMFNPCKGIAEFEYWLAQRARERQTEERRQARELQSKKSEKAKDDGMVKSERVSVFPIQGQTLNRLLKLGWLTRSEVEMRCHSSDLERLRLQESSKEYPWKCYAGIPVETKEPTVADAGGGGMNDAKQGKPEINLKMWTAADIPTLEERQIFLNGYYGHFYSVERCWKDTQAQKRRKDEQDKEAQEALARFGVKYGDNTGHQRDLSPSKRRIADAGVPEDQEMADPKRQRRSKAAPQIPTKQYPAPLVSYPEDLYPEAAYFINSQSQQKRNYKPATRPVTPPSRSDTPPPSPPRPTTNLNRTLSRTTTLAQIC